MGTIIKKIVLLLLLILVAIPMMSLAQNQDYALVYIQRLKKSTNSDVSYNIWFNDQKIGELRKIPVAFTSEAKERWLISKRVESGKFYLRVTDGKKNSEIDKLILDTKPGRSYYITFDPSAAYGQKALNQLSLQEGHETFAKADMELVSFAQGDISQVVTKNKYAILEEMTTLNETDDNINDISNNNTVRNQDQPNANNDIIYIINPLLNAANHYIASNVELDLRGKLTSGNNVSMLIINGEEVNLSSDFFFEKNIVLSPGINTIFVLAKDNNGTTISKKKITIEYQKSDVSKNAIALIDNNNTNYYALLIGVNDYNDPEINDLDNPISDAEKLYQTLTKQYTFDNNRVTMLKNPTYSQLIIALDELTKKITPNDNLLIFYAGHGYWDEKTGIGYWLPADASKSNTANWFRNSTLKDYIGAINSKHTILIADACFSGGIFKTRSAFSDANVGIQKLYELPSRKAMTSGTLTEVPDKSAFIQYLVKRLQENNEKYISSEELFSSFRAAVLANSPTIPQFGEIKDVGDEGGDFIFIKRGQ